MRRPGVIFALVCTLALIFFGLRMHEWGQLHSLRIAMTRDELGSHRKSSLITKLQLPKTNATEHSLIESARADLLLLPPSPMRAVAIRIADADILDPETGLGANSQERGRAWERPAGVAVSQNGRELLAAPAGLRLQGNRGSRDMLQSFRLYFRNSYGMKDIPASALLDGSEMDLRKVILRTEKNTTPGFVSMLAFDVARRVGATTPDFAPILMLRNGENLGLGLASEHINRVHWERKLGHSNFAFFVFESENSVLDIASYRALTFRLNSLFGLWDYERVAGMLDLDDFMTAMTSFSFLQWQDWNQGALILDRTETTPRWRSVLWDADLAFAGLRSGGIPKNRAGWKNLRDAHGMRAAVFKGLWDESARFRDEFLLRLSWSVNHRLTREWITDRVDYYARMEKQAGLDCFDEEAARSYLLQRRRNMLDEAVAELGAPEIVLFRMQSYGSVRIDGSNTSGEYEGLYFKGQKTILEAGSAPGFSHWILDGQEVHEPRIELIQDRNTSIRAVFLPVPTTP